MNAIQYTDGIHRWNSLESAISCMLFVLNLENKQGNVKITRRGVTIGNEEIGHRRIWAVRG